MVWEREVVGVTCGDFGNGGDGVVGGWGEEVVRGSGGDRVVGE